MSFSARPLLLRSKFQCTNIRPLRSLFSSTPARPARTPVRVGQKAPSKAATAVPPIQRVLRPPLELLKTNPNTAQSREKIKIAKTLVDSGDTLLYEAPSHAGFLTATFLTGTMCFIGVVSTFSTDLWKSKDVPFWINTANQMGIVCFTFLGGWIVLRAARHITSIKLMLQNDRVKMLVTVRRMIPLPLVPSKKIVMDPVDFVLPSRMVAQMAMPSWLDNQGQEITGTLTARMVNRISRALWTFFAGMRKVFTHEGFLDVTIHGTKGLWKLDTSGTFAKEGRNLFDIVSYET